jgi:hypothetical protein
MTAEEAPATSALAAAWDRYWGEHPELPSWHGATHQRRAKAAAGKTDPCELDEAFSACEIAPFAGGQVYMAADVSSGNASQDGPAKRRAQIELMFAAVARTVVVAAASFTVEPAEDDGADAAAGCEATPSPPSSSVATFRCQMANSEDAMTIARELESFVSLGIDDGHAAVTPTRLIVRGPGLGRLLKGEGGGGVTHAQLLQLFEVFGECDVALPDTTSVQEFEELVVADAAGKADSPVVSVVFTSPLPGCAEADAHAALRTVQQHLAYDWGLIATYDAVSPSPASDEAVAAADEDADGAWPADGKRLRDNDGAVAADASGDADAAPRVPPVLRRAVRGAPISSS